MKFFGKQSNPVQNERKRGAILLQLAGGNPEALRLFGKMMLEGEIMGKSQFPEFGRFQDVRATPAFFEEIVADMLMRKGMDSQLRAKLDGLPLVDLCCGDEVSVAASRKIAAHYGARLELVDLHLPAGLIGVQNGVKGTKTDALAYVASMPDNSANFLMCGIDSFIIDDNSYWQRLAQEIEKKTVPGGILMGTGSNIYKYLNFRVLHEGSINGTDIVMEKF